jgi:hypothetical protein
VEGLETPSRPPRLPTVVLPKGQLLSSRLVSQSVLLPSSVAAGEEQEISTTSPSVLSSLSMKNLSVNQHRRRE